jgi:hypothetical protein
VFLSEPNETKIPQILWSSLALVRTKGWVVYVLVDLELGLFRL